MTIYFKDIYPATLSLRIIHHYIPTHVHIFFVGIFAKDNLNYLNASGQNKFVRVNYITMCFMFRICVLLNGNLALFPA